MSVNDDRPAGVQSVHRALDLLETIGQQEEAGVTQLAEELGLAVSTVHNLLRTLALRDYLSVDRGRYRLGSALMVLSSYTDPSRTLTTLIQPALERMSVTTGHSATATALVGKNAHLIGYTPGTDMITVNQAQMMWRNPLALATGRVLVASRPEVEWGDFIAAGRDEIPEWSSEDWEAEFRAVGESGCCVKFLDATEEAPHHVTAVAVPVWARNAVVSCSIGIAVPARLEAERINRLLEELWRTTTQLSQQLGCAVLPRGKPHLP